MPHTQDTPLVVILFTETVLKHSRSKVSAVWVSYSTYWWWLSVLFGGCWSGGQRAPMRAIPGLTKEKFLNIVWSTLLMSVRSAHDSRGFSLINSLSKLLQSLGDVCKGGGQGNTLIHAMIRTIHFWFHWLTICCETTVVCLFWSIWSSWSCQPRKTQDLLWQIIFHLHGHKTTIFQQN